MIRSQNLIPEVYVDRSRDMQVLGRLYDFTLNPVKFNASSILNITNPLKVKSTILPLVGDKEGIKGQEAVTNRQLLQALPLAMQYKGSLHSIKILLNAFLDSLQMFSYSMAFHCKDKESAKELEEMIKRPVQEYSIVIVLSQFPSMVNLQVLDEYLRMVVPTGMIIDYSFGTSIEEFDRYRYVEYCFLSFISDYPLGEELYVVDNTPGAYRIETDTTPESEFVKEFIKYQDINSVGIATVER